MKDTQLIRIFDTTLRDGQQCPGAGMNKEQNLAYALLAADLNVDVLEVGFPSASKNDFEIVNEIAVLLADKKADPEIAALCQLREGQIVKTMEALTPALKDRKALVHIYVPVAPELMEASLGKKSNKIKIIEDTGRFISLASKSGYSVEFSPEGYSKQSSNFDFVSDLIATAVEMGAQIINCPDTIGFSFSGQAEKYFVNLMNQHSKLIKSKFPEKKIIWSTHCHNDYGLAVQNSINAVLDGPATQIEGCFNGVGERAGNAALEAIIMIIDQHGQLDSLGKRYHTNINLSRLQEISDFVKKHMLPRQPHWPITGDNSSKHSSGGHTNAVLTDPLAYQPFDPKKTGNKVSLVFGPLSGGNHAKSVIEEWGYLCKDDEKIPISQFIKDKYSDRRKGITDEELIQGYIDYRSPLQISNYDYSRSSSNVSLELTGKVFNTEGFIKEVHLGKDSALAALKNLINRDFKCDILSHRSESNREGIDAESISHITISSENKLSFEGVGLDNDIEISALKALVDAVNKAYVFLNYKIKSKDE